LFGEREGWKERKKGNNKFLAFYNKKRKKKISKHAETPSLPRQKFKAGNASR
jgi:hypothetical protein